MSREILSTLAFELQDIENHAQNPETGAGIGTNQTYLPLYTMHVFGCPFQFMDSVDKRFLGVNQNIGNEFLKNFILLSPILHIKPGMPIYTGGSTGSELLKQIKEVYTDFSSGNLSMTEAMLESAAKSTIFSSGSKLQKRMFGFRETYAQYMSHVNYICRSMAIYLGLTDSDKFPNGAYANGSISLQSFKDFRWENYRMLSNVTVMTPTEYWKELSRSTLLGAVKGIVLDVAKDILQSPALAIQGAAEAIREINYEDANTGNLFNDILAIGSNVGTTITTAVGAGLGAVGSAIGNDVSSTVSHFMSTTTTDVIVNKASSVLFMVEPGSYEETYSNRTEESIIAQTIDGITSGVGQELAFITNSEVDFGLADDLLSFLGNTVQSATTAIAGLVKPLTGGFVSNMLNGAMQAVKGQKMIYPKIYKGSDAARAYNFSIKLATPYGDPYNYYMEMLVPLAHLLCLVNPRMVTANTVASPYLVQVTIPGNVTCNLGIVSQMTVTKNPTSDRVSVHGYPLEIEVKFTVEELYNTLPISPANDPASFLFNETLNDYMANMAGLMPSTDTYTKQRKIMFNNLETYFSSGEYWDDYKLNKINKLEVKYNSAIANGS